MNVRRGGIAARGGCVGCSHHPPYHPPVKKTPKISLEGAAGLSPAAVPQGTIWQYTWWV